MTGSVVDTTNAHSNQILAMTQTYHKILGDDFLFFSPTIKRQKNANGYHQQIKVFFKSRWMRYLELSIKLKLFHSKKIRKDELIITRDIFLAYIFNRKSNKVLYEVHNQFHTQLGQFLIKRLISKIGFIFSCNGLREYFKNQYGISGNHALVAHNGVFLDKYQNLNIKRAHVLKKHSLPEEKTILLHSGSLYKGRGIELLEPIVNSYDDVFVVCVGGKPDDVKYWKNFYKKNQNIAFLGHFNSDELIEIQKVSDINFLPMTENNPIWWATSPLKLFEYLASPGILLASKKGSLLEVVNEENALLFNPYDTKDLIKKMEIYFHQPEEIKRIKNNQKKLARVYTWNNRALKILEFGQSVKL